MRSDIISCFFKFFPFMLRSSSTSAMALLDLQTQSSGLLDTPTTPRLAFARRLSHCVCARGALRRAPSGRGPEQGVPPRGRGRGSWGTVLAGSEPEVQALLLLLGQAEPALLGPVAAKKKKQHFSFSRPNGRRGQLPRPPGRLPRLLFCAATARPCVPLARRYPLAAATAASSCCPASWPAPLQ